MEIKKIFFSYSRADGSDFAIKLAMDLKKEGFDIWIDQEDIRAGSEWDLEIEKALETCDCLLFIETEKSVSSNNVLDEVYYALQENKKVIPVIHVDSKTPFRLQRLQHIDFTKNYHNGLSLLINELKGTADAESVNPLEARAAAELPKSFYKKYAWIVATIIALLVLATIFFIYTGNKRSTDETQTIAKENAEDTAKALTTEILDIPPQSRSGEVERQTELSARKMATVKNKKEKNSEPGPDSGPARKSNYSPESLAGDWKLSSVDPAAASKNGYLKIEAADENKVMVKSFIQFYYNKTNDTSFLSVFNAFAGCNSCVPSGEMKLIVEDVSIGSQYYKISEKNNQGKGTSGDTLSSGGSNKSIRALVHLNFLDNTHAIMKVERNTTAELSHGLVMNPFIYTFRFSKVD